MVIRGGSAEQRRQHRVEPEPAGVGRHERAPVEDEEAAGDETAEPLEIGGVLEAPAGEADEARPVDALVEGQRKALRLSGPVNATRPPDRRIVRALRRPRPATSGA